MAMQHKILSNLKSPKDIRGYNNEELLDLCKEIRSFTIDTITEIGGHLAPTLGVVELSVALHYVFNTPKDKLVWDVGHQGYAHKLLTGRFNDFKTIRKFNGLSGFLKRSESEYDEIGAGHASTSISAALGIAEARRQKDENFRVAAIIGDGSMTGGLAFEGINNAGHLGKQFLVILNDNEMSISPNVGAISRYFTRLISNPLYNKVRNEFWDITGKLPVARSKTRALIKKVEESLKSLLVPGILFDELGFRYFGPIDGHDLSELVNTLNNIKDIQNPVLLHILTKKGKGMVSLDMKNREYHDDAIRFHAVKAGSNQNVQPKVKKSKTIQKSSIPIFQDVFGKLVCEIAQTRKDTVCITAAMREGTGLVEYSKMFPARYYDVGIAEGHAVTFASGLASQGIRPIVAIYSTFLQRAYDHIIHDCAIQHLPVIFCLDRSGIAGEDGPTHHGALDLSYLRCIQDLILTSPKNGNEFRNLLHTALNIVDKPFAIRYPKSSSIEFDYSGQMELLPIGSWEICKEGKDGAILAVGPMVYNALDVAKKMNSVGINLEVVNCRFIKPMDISYLSSAVSKFSNLITLEESNISGGFGDGVSSWLLENNFKGKLKRIGLPDSFVQHGSRIEILKSIGLDSDSLFHTVQSAFDIKKQD
ncbi:MAG: 1-deoxy-D-xylulose-5-phosphate synthase [Candidatus Marinimicrobia bacterium]|nr:1-deoxy-D-xylulose-5-phosphate synthase [Candidatus Neomarinimicrobiota bacterium]